MPCPTQTPAKVINSFSRFMIFGVLFFSFTACASMANSDNIKEVTPVKISLLDKNNKLLAKTLDQEKTRQIIAIINKRKPLLEKIMPIFRMQLIIESETGKEIWLFAKPGYLQHKSTENNQVYYVDKQLLQVLLKEPLIKSN